ncbi:MAG: hypothetical protein J6I72_02390 [Muribaculaceae bacterium]|nr:hypothetical protein [Muribaculaceae bacterium]
MKYTCPKCGKSIEVSTESLIASEYFIVCPQCLTRLQIVGDYAYVPLKDGSLQLEQPKPDSAEEVEILPPPLTGETIPAATPTVQPAAIDPLFGEAVRFLGQCNAITPMMLRDRLGITLERAQALIGQLEQAGIVGPYNHGGPRQILIPHNTGMPSPFQPTPNSESVGSNYQPSEAKNDSDNKTYSFTCSGCLTWFLIASIAIFMLKACTG